MKRTLLIVLAAVLLLAVVAVFAFGFLAARPDSMRLSRGYTANAPALTAQQEADLEESFDEMISLRKETILKMMEDGLLSEERGQLVLERLEAMDALHDANDGSYVFGGGCGGYYGGYNGGYGRGMARYYNDFDQD